MKRPKKHWYERKNLKQVSGFLTAHEKNLLRKSADSYGLTLTSHVTRLCKVAIQRYLAKISPAVPNPPNQD